MAKAKTVKGTSTGNVEVIIGNAATSLKKATVEAAKVFEQLDKAAEESAKVTEQVELKAAELDKLSTDFAEKERQALLDLSMKVRENKKEVVDETLREFGMEAIESDSLIKLKDENEKYKKDFDAEVHKEVSKVKAITEANHKAQLELQTERQKAAEATLKADFEAQKKTIVFLEGQINMLNKQMSEERNARVEEAKARGNAVVTVNSGK